MLLRRPSDELDQTRTTPAARVTCSAAPSMPAPPEMSPGSGRTSSPWAQCVATDEGAGPVRAPAPAEAELATADPLGAECVPGLREPLAPEGGPQPRAPSAHASKPEPRSVLLAIPPFGLERSSVGRNVDVSWPCHLVGRLGAVAQDGELDSHHLARRGREVHVPFPQVRIHVA